MFHKLKRRRVPRLSAPRLDSSERPESQLRQRPDAAQPLVRATDRAEKDFLAIVSHELRTPLSGIIGMSQILLETQISADQRRTIETIVASSEALLVIVNDVLDYSKIAAGKLELRPVRFDLRHILQEVVTLLSPRAADNGGGVILEYAAGLPVWFTGDAGRIRQIVTNLLGNAVKFTRSGRISITVDGAGTGGSYNLKIAVTDDGPGIPPDRLAGIFEEFVQFDTSTKDKAGGTGLGLPISKRLAELMGGQIEVRSEIGIGSTFTLMMPLTTAGPSLSHSTAGQSEGFKESLHTRQQAGRPVRVLAAEDNKTNRQILASMLKTENVELILACDGKEAVEMFLRAVPDVILMDLGMPELNGLEATSQIRDLEWSNGLRRTPIVALTANAMRGDRDLCLAAHMDDYMSKPLLKNGLIAMLEKWSCQTDRMAGNPPLELDRRQSGNAPKAIEGRQQHVAPVVDEVRVAALIADLGVETFSQIADQFCRDMEEALEGLAACVTASNFDEIQVTLQLIRSCAANLGIARIVQICDRLRRNLDGESGPSNGVVEELTGEFGKAKARLSAVLGQNGR